jgi:hypothetical protein
MRNQRAGRKTPASTRVCETLARSGGIASLLAGRPSPPQPPLIPSGSSTRLALQKGSRKRITPAVPPWTQRCGIRITSRCAASWPCVSSHAVVLREGCCSLLAARSDASRLLCAATASPLRTTRALRSPPPRHGHRLTRIAFHSPVFAPPAVELHCRHAQRGPLLVRG